MKKSKLTRPVWAEVNLDHIKFNLNQVIKNVPEETMVMAVVKADAYGHGVLPVAHAAVEAGADRLAVALPEEGRKLREADFELPIQILGEVLPKQVSILVENDLIPTISKLETVEQLDELANKKGITKKVHVKVDTGMGRIGVFPDNALDFIKEVMSFENIKVEGLMTHFAKADEEDKDYTYNQWDQFQMVIDRLEEENIDIPIKQAANSATIIDLPHMALNMVRPGIMMYGLRPSHEVDQDFKLKPALSWKAQIVYLKEVPPGTGISYGATYITKKKAKIATIPMGYADGYARLLSNKGEVLINGQRAPIRGRVCMDQFMVDVTHIDDVKIGDEVVLIGKQGDAEFSATEMADLIGTINYEITCDITKRVPRIYK
ncbi:MAG TPA: alanine racemase [Halanaerobiales bacterium]|nr:alanine racemase [Halanaerobiales bacterium]